MTIDTNTVLLTVLSAAVAFFAVAYFRSKINERFTAIQRHHDDNMAEMFQTHDRMYRQIHDLERKVECCRNKSEKCDKNFYNTQA
jgi:uncharacterized coiled-coil DUF342 family protein